MGLRLDWRSATTLPIEARGLLPGALAELSALDAARLRLPVGNTSVELGVLFQVAESSEEGPDLLRLSGDLRHVQGLGRGMSGGTIQVDGDVGDEVGAGMSGGIIEVTGHVGDRAGSEMTGGRLRVGGNAGDELGSALPGSRLGMREGMILVQGSVGDSAGRRMRRGLIAARGGMGEFTGSAMIAGTIVALGSIGAYPGLGMKRGTIVVVGSGRPRLSPTFAASGAHRFPFLSFYFRELERAGLPVPPRVYSAAFHRYNGDQADGGQGEILVEAVDGD